MMIARESRKVATGRLMKGAEKCTASTESAPMGASSLASSRSNFSRSAAVAFSGARSPARSSGPWRPRSSSLSPGRGRSRGAWSPGLGSVKLTLVSGEGFGQVAAVAVVGWVLAAVGVLVELFVGPGGAEVLAPDTVEEEIDNRSGEEREHLRDEQTADDGDAERGAELRAGAAAECERNSAEERGHRGHHDGTEAQKAGLIDGLFGRHALFALGFESEVDHHDGVLFNDADQKDDSYKRDDREAVAGDEQRENGADAGGRQRGE